MVKEPYKAFWIGEKSEIYVGTGVIQLYEYLGDRSWNEIITNKQFGEVTDSNYMVHTTDGKYVSLSKYLEKADSPHQIGSGYL